MKIVLHLIAYSAVAVTTFVLGAAVGIAGSGASSPGTRTVTTTATTSAAGAVRTTTASPRTVTSSRTATVTAEPPAPATAIPGDGTFEVGVDVEPGTYVSEASPGGNCYWARLSGSESFDDIIANNNSSGQSLVTIAATDRFFESSGCSDWTRR